MVGSSWRTLGSDLGRNPFFEDHWFRGIRLRLIGGNRNFFQVLLFKQLEARVDQGVVGAGSALLLDGPAVRFFARNLADGLVAAHYLRIRVLFHGVPGIVAESTGRVWQAHN